MKARRIRLHCGRYALVDARDYERVRRRHWHIKAKVYAATHIGGNKYVYLHNFITGHLRSEHRNGHGLDCQRHNLRRATQGQNTLNNRPQKRGRSPYKGVSWHTGNGRWAAQIKPPGEKRVWLGLFDTQLAAAHAYDKAAREYFGEFAWLNFGRTG